MLFKPRAATRMAPLLVGGAIALTVTDGRSQSGPDVFPPDAIVFGRTYAEWSAEWWQWNLSIPIPANPPLDTTGQHCRVQQSRPVFFLAGSPMTDPVSRDCTVPSDTPLFFPIITVECSNVEAAPFFGSTDEERRACAEGFIDAVDIGTLSVTVDGEPVPDPSKFRVVSPPFDFRMPARQNILELPGVTSGDSASDGYWIMLGPLPEGHHDVHFAAEITSGPFAGFSQDITYNLTVK
jgi:hypothetical protein